MTLLCPAIARDAPGMSAMLQLSLTGWNSLPRGDPAHVLAQYVVHSARLACTLACDPASGDILGFQSLKHA